MGKRSEGRGDGQCKVRSASLRNSLRESAAFAVAVGTHSFSDSATAYGDCSDIRN